MTIQSREVVSTNETTYTAGTGNTMSSSSAVSSDMFYQMLAAQLQYQDPMESVDSSQMILQMAQFAQIEASNNLTQQFNVFLELNSMAIGADMVGKEVMVAVQNEDGTSGTKTGIVDRVGYTSNGPILEVDGDYYEIWSVITVTHNNQTIATTPELEEPKPEVPEVA